MLTAKRVMAVAEMGAAVSIVAAVRMVTAVEILLPLLRGSQQRGPPLPPVSLKLRLYMVHLGQEVNQQV